MLNNAFVNQVWEKMIANVDKYFHSPIVNTEEEIRSFIVSDRKSWCFDMLNKVYGNVNSDGEYMDFTHPSFMKGVTRRCVFCDNENKVEYRMFCKPYLNGNTLITIKISRN